jgi:hypothetical protein
MKACGGLAVVLGFVTLCSTAAAQPTETEARDAALRKQFVAAYEAANAGIVAGDDAALRIVRPSARFS